jgi:hypothetical protein
MTKSVISHENNNSAIASLNTLFTSTNNTSNISATPFFDSWKSTLLAQAKLLNVAVPTTESIDFKVILDSVNERLLQQSESIDNLQYIVDTSSDFSDVLTAQEQLYLQKAAFYNIKLNSDQWCSVTDLHMFDAVDSWEKKLKEALYLGVNWRMSDYDPNGLEQAIDEQELSCNLDAQEDRRAANAYYYSTRGC